MGKRETLTVTSNIGWRFPAELSAAFFRDGKGQLIDVRCNDVVSAVDEVFALTGRVGPDVKDPILLSSYRVFEKFHLCPIAVVFRNFLKDVSIQIPLFLAENVASFPRPLFFRSAHE